MARATAITPKELEALVATDAVAAWAKAEPLFKLPVPRASVPLVSNLLKLFRGHGAKLPVGYRRALIAFVERASPFVTAAKFNMATAPHADYVAAVVALYEEQLEGHRVVFRGNGEIFGMSWDDPFLSTVLAAVGDARAAPVLEALLVQADKVKGWDSMLEACERSGAPRLIPALISWRERMRKVNPTWEGIARASKVIAALTATARKRGEAVPSAPALAPLVFEPRPKKKASAKKSK